MIDPTQVQAVWRSVFESRMRDHSDPPRAAEARDLTVTELCKVSGVSERTLQYAFTDIFSITPQGYLINYRLAQARTLLLTGGADRVADAMRACGMRHAQRFAQYFRAM